MKDALKLYTIDADYVKYLSQINPHLYKDDKQRRRKYIGIVLQIKELQYFVPLTSFKKKHKALSDSLDFMKIGNIAAININMMFPVPRGLYHVVDIDSEKDSFYKSLLVKESRYIKTNAELITNNARVLYAKVTKNPESKLAKKSNSFKLLEEVCQEYVVIDKKG